jgi:hypothetical protein
VREIVHWSSERGSADEQVKALWYRILYHQWGLTWVQTRALLVRSVVSVPKRKTKRKKTKNTHRILYLLLIIGTTSLPSKNFQFWEFQIEFSRVLTAEK